MVATLAIKTNTTKKNHTT